MSSIDHPSSPTSEVEDSSTPAIGHGDTLNDADAPVSESTRSKRRKTLRNATSAQVVDSQAHAPRVTTEVAPGQAAIPAWAQAMNNKFDALLNVINDPNTGLRALHIRVDIESARSLNRTCVRGPLTQITPLPNGNGVLPGVGGVWFPANTSALHGASYAKMNQLIAFYGLAEGGTLDAKRRRIKNLWESWWPSTS